MTSSSDAVLQTTELLQEILLQLDMRTLLTAAQLVNRQWHDVITTSPALQQALYFAPVVSSAYPATQNPLLSELFPYWFQEGTGGDNPHALKEVKEISRLDFGCLPMAQESRRHAFMYPNATWRHMLVRQPPVLTLGRWTTSHSSWGNNHRIHIDEIPGGLRMDRLYDIAQRWLRRTVSNFVVFRGPNAVTAYARTLYGSLLDPIEKGQLQALSRRVDLIVLRHMVVQCSMESGYPEYDEAFAFPGSQEQQDDL
ncbi:hypothetical protein F5B22DRAFT_80086 [Xylaria bambusicola]|uniref:uncharacterized protein n=1 Tax=Xylaria bambusicola TaxID=326684 RepID=UPI002008A7F6|nr:uncharacterized protein F5B22DRAFT_80086 [Xylaria bambusicola]KAI0518284.1 hypothetical protein F5B22DRAFT_80086 [Xylaria bambusicola]